MQSVNWALLTALTIAGTANGTELVFKDQLLNRLVENVPGMLRSFDSGSGRFGTGIWICRDQHPMYPLAVVYATRGEDNRYYKDPKLLDVIVKSGDPLIENMDAQGQWVFAKKDGSTWGKIWMPWTEKPIRRMPRCDAGRVGVSLGRAGRELGQRRVGPAGGRDQRP